MIRPLSLPLALSLLLSILVLAGCARAQELGFSPSVQPLGLGEAAASELVEAPDFSLTTFDGQHVALADLEGQAVVLNFWATWCLPCRTEMPYFETTYRAYQEREVAFVGVTVLDDPDEARAFLAELEITYPSGLDVNQRITLDYQVLGLPTTVFIRPDGTIARHWAGAISEQHLIELVEEVAG